MIFQRNKVFKRISLSVANLTKESIEKYKTGVENESSTIEIPIGDVVTEW